MKEIKVRFLALMAFITILPFLSVAQKDGKTKSLAIKTSIQCEMCEERIMGNLPFEKGIKDIKVDIPTKVVTVTYHTDKTSPEKIRMAISELGYDADEVPADPEAYAKLPKCCQKGGHL